MPTKASEGGSSSPGSDPQAAFRAVVGGLNAAAAEASDRTR